MVWISLRMWWLLKFAVWWWGSHAPGAWWAEVSVSTPWSKALQKSRTEKFSILKSCKSNSKLGKCTSYLRNLVVAQPDDLCHCSTQITETWYSNVLRPYIHIWRNNKLLLICQETLGSTTFRWVMTHRKLCNRPRAVTVAVLLYVNKCYLLAQWLPL